MKLCFITTASYCLLLCTTGYANNMSLGGLGASPYPIKQHQVSMLSEHITIRGSRLADQYKQRAWHVNCHYVFQNDTNKAMTLRVGFPYPVLTVGFLAAVPPGHINRDNKSMLYNFTTTVNGKAIPTTNLKLSSSIHVEEELHYSHAYTFNLKFNPHQTLAVDHHYISGVTHNPQGYFWAQYILKTGGLWRSGVIKHAVFDIIPGVKSRLCRDFKKDPHPSLNPQPAGMQIKGHGSQRLYRWDLHNFKPTHDLSLCIQTAQSYIHNRYVLHLSGADYNKKSRYWNFSKKQLTYIKDAIYAQYGKTFTNKHVQKKFNKEWWYSPNLHYSSKRLTDLDHYALKWINRRLEDLNHQSSQSQL